MRDEQLLVDWITTEIKKIEDDERYHYPPANIQINAPLALIQLEFTSRIRALKQVRGVMMGAYEAKEPPKGEA